MFVIKPHGEIDKSFELYDKSSDIWLTFDYDDVNHDRVDFIALTIANLLNDNIEWIQQELQQFDKEQQEEWAKD